MSFSRLAWLVAVVSLSFAVPTGLFAAAVKDFGAIGDGRADDTAAVQRTVDAGGTVAFTTGTYRLTRPIVIELQRTGFIALSGDTTVRIVMAGAGPAFHFIGTHGGSAAPAQFKPEVWDRQRGPSVTGLEIVGAHPEADGIAARGTMQLTISRVIVREARHAIRLYERNRNVLISDVHLYHNRGIGIYYDQVDLHQSNITGAHISYNAGGGIVSRGGNVRNVHIGNCDIESNMTAVAPATANILLDSTGGSIGEVAITGCTIQHTNTGPDSANIRILGAGRISARDDRPTREGHITITGNVLSDVQVNVHLRHVRGVTLTGNTFWMGFTHDLLVEDSSHVVIGPNNLDRNPRYEYTRTSARGGVVLRRVEDCTISGLHVSGVRHHAAAVLIEDCRRLQASSGAILDSDGVGLRLVNSDGCRIAGWMIRDDRGGNALPGLQVSGGRGNVITDNVLDRAPDISAGAGLARGNRVLVLPPR